MNGDLDGRPATLSARDRGAPGEGRWPMIDVAVASRPGLSPHVQLRTGAVPWLLVGLGVVGATAGIAGALMCAANWMRGAPWDVNDIVLMVAAWTSNVLGLGVGSWWWWRAPANPTGRLLYLAALSDCIYMIGRCWPGSAWAAELTWSSVLINPCLALVVLGWPTGRPGRRVRNAVIGSGIGVGVLDLIGGVFSRTPHPAPGWPDLPESQFTVPSVSHLLDPVQALLLQAFPAAVLIVVLIRRRHSVPPAVRPLITPITVAGVLSGASLIAVHVGYQLLANLFGFRDGFTVRALLLLLGGYSMIGFVAIGVLVGATRRRRAAALGARRIVVDLGTATPVISPSAAAAATVGDPSAQVRYVSADGTWIDSAGAPTSELGDDRVRLPVFDEDGQAIAAIELRAATALPPLLADLAVKTIAARAANERATALAEARRAEVRGRSRELVAAADAGRRQLERNLHDGAQQLLIGLSLTAGLAVRAAEPGAPAAVIAHIAQVRREILELLDAAPPAALASGLSGALRTLSATCPVPVVFESTGDLAATDPLALSLYLVAGEAITNALKHAAPSLIRMVLTVTEGHARLRVQDDGRGGLREVAPSIASRVQGLGLALVEHPPGHGSAVVVRMPRTAAQAAGAIR